jgi:hypothetical protein
MSRPVESTVPVEVPPIHQPFSWVGHIPNDHNANFAALTLNVCQGVQTCLELIHSTDLAISSGAGDENPPILGVEDKERLLLLSTATMRMLGRQAEEHIAHLGEQARARAAAAAQKGGAR